MMNVLYGIILRPRETERLVNLKQFCDRLWVCVPCSALPSSFAGREEGGLRWARYLAVGSWMAEWVQFGTGKLCGMVQKALCTTWYNTANSVGALWTIAWYGWAQHGYYPKGNGRWQWRIRYRHIMVQSLLLGIWYFVIWYLNAGKRILPSTGSKVVSLTLSLPPWLPHHQTQVNQKLTKITI